jgi:hypothetical protein
MIELMRSPCTISDVHSAMMKLLLRESLYVVFK